MADYVPKPDQEGINSTQEQNHVKDAMILLAGFLGVLTIGYLVLVSASDWVLKQISIEQEIKWFGKVWEPKSSEPQSKDFVELVAKVNEQLPFKANFTVVCSKDINAFALPGGRILLTSALLENLKSENGLVFVMGHEAGHILNRDHVRGLGRQLIFALGGSLLGFTDASSLALINTTIRRVYDRHQESHADNYGIELNKKVYGHTWGSDELFEILDKREGTFQRAFSRIASTHPPSADRRAALKLTQIGVPEILRLPARPFSEWVQDLGCQN